MANAKPASAAPEDKPKAPKKVPDGPKIEYFGDGADKVKFTVDPKAKSVRVYANGLILTDY
jgi:hypothetical protein